MPGMWGISGIFFTPWLSTHDNGEGSIKIVLVLVLVYAPPFTEPPHRDTIPLVRTIRSIALPIALLLAACATGQRTDDGGEGDYLAGERPGGGDLSLSDADGNMADRGTGDQPVHDATPDLPVPDVLQPDLLQPDQQVTGTITVSAPTSGSHSVGGSLKVTWTGTGPVGQVNLELWRGSKKHCNVAQNRPSSGSHSWKIPASTPGGSYRVKVVSGSMPKVFGYSQTFTVVGWSYRVTVSIDATKSKTTLVNYPVAVTLTAKGFAYANARGDGADLRFSTTMVLGGAFLPQWMEQFNPKGTSTVWVKVPKLPAGKTTSIYLFYGHAKAGASSSKTKTFPKRFVSTGGLSLSGNQTYDWFELKAGHMLTLPPQKMLTVTARKIVVHGIIQGSGAGFLGGQGSGQAGKGPGGGAPGSGAGGGGGGYGGSGGKGGYDGTDNPGSGGNACGTINGVDVHMGSGGGAGNSQKGGNGGGAVSLSAHDVEVTGTILLDGTTGKGGAQSGGGGSGGGVLLRGHHITAAGTWSVKGGKGGSGTITANDGGGGGGGGRIKLLYGQSLSNKVAAQRSGGAGGKYGGKAHGVAGGKGTFTTSKQSYSVTSVKVGSETKL